MMTHKQWLLSLMLWFPLALAAAENPLAQPAADFAGVFQSRELTLRLHTVPDGYQGTITREGQTYPVQAAAHGSVLSGRFHHQGQWFTFSARHEPPRLILETGGSRYTLQAGRTAPDAGAPLPSPLADTHSPREDFAALTLSTGLELHQFVAALRYWLSGAITDHQAMLLMKAHLSPGAKQIRNGFETLEERLRDLVTQTTLSSGDQQGLRKLAELCHKGGVFFRDWATLLDNMLQLHSRGQKDELQKIAATHLPGAVKGSVAYAHDFTLLVRAAGLIENLQTDTASASLEPENLLKWETLRSMSDTMREGMDLFKNLRAR